MKNRIVNCIIKNRTPSFIRCRRHAIDCATIGAISAMQCLGYQMRFEMAIEF